MKALRQLLDKAGRLFQPGGKFQRLFYLYEAVDTFIYTTGKVTTGRVHVRDFMDLKRMMITVFVALLPAVLMALYNTGFQANLILGQLASIQPSNWQQSLLIWLGIPFDPQNFWANILHDLKQHFAAFYDDSGSIGRRYRRQDEAGTPYAITVDSQTLTDGTVTLRERDSLEQIRLPKERLIQELKSRLENK